MRAQARKKKAKGRRADAYGTASKVVAPATQKGMRSYAQQRRMR